MTSPPLSGALSELQKDGTVAAVSSDHGNDLAHTLTPSARQARDEWLHQTPVPAVQRITNTWAEKMRLYKHLLLMVATFVLTPVLLAISTGQLMVWIIATGGIGIDQISLSDVSLSRAWFNEWNQGVSGDAIMVGRTIFLSLPFNHVVALDAVTQENGYFRRYDHQRKSYPMCGPANRGVALS